MGAAFLYATFSNYALIEIQIVTLEHQPQFLAPKKKDVEYVIHKVNLYTGSLTFCIVFFLLQPNLFIDCLFPGNVHKCFILSSKKQPLAKINYSDDSLHKAGGESPALLFLFGATMLFTGHKVCRAAEVASFTAALVCLFLPHFAF